jgi:serine/threonine protein kinase/Flp pilus assembly protein TadD
MAEVYLGRALQADGRFGPAVAVKRLLPHLNSDPAIVRMFLNEAEITQQIHHPNVVEIIDLGHFQNEPFIAMELLEGHSFAELRQTAAQSGKRVPLGVTLRILTEACRGLDAAHRAVDSKGRELQIVHRDFTPDNIHVAVTGEVKVIDFGIAKSALVGGGTEPGTLKGKFFYMSPEMIAGQDVDHRADLFAAGVMLYEQLCGRRPFTGLNTEEVLNRISEGRPKRPTEFDPSVPLGLELICLKALSRDPAKRFPSLVEFVSAIEGVGGPARVATTEEVADYVGAIFPAEEDPKRIALRRARLADPSTPTRSPDATALDLLPPREDGRPPRRITDPPRKREPSKLELQLKAAARWVGRPEILGPLALVAVLGAGTVAYLKRPQQTPAIRLARAEAASNAATRTKELVALTEDPKASEPELRRAGELALRAAASRALQVTQAFARRYPKSIDAALQEARACIGLRLGKRADAAIDRALSLDPEDPRPDLLRADLRRMQGDASGMLEALTSASRKAPNVREIAVRRGELLSQAGRLDEASAVLGSVLRKRFHPGAAAELGFVKPARTSRRRRCARSGTPPLAQSRQGALLPGRRAGAQGDRARVRPSTTPRTSSRPATPVPLARCAPWPPSGASRRRWRRTRRSWPTASRSRRRSSSPSADDRSPGRLSARAGWVPSLRGRSAPADPRSRSAGTWSGSGGGSARRRSPRTGSGSVSRTGRR